MFWDPSCASNDDDQLFDGPVDAADTFGYTDAACNLRTTGSATFTPTISSRARVALRSSLKREKKRRGSSSSEVRTR